MSDEPQLCPECLAKWDAWADKLDTLVCEMGGEGELEGWQVVDLLIAVAGVAARRSDVSIAEFMTMVRQVVGDEFGLTITGIAIDSPDFTTEGEA